jgi:N-acetylmuramic acid 6-phosphate (MurNAc-6-P) etherase
MIEYASTGAMTRGYVYGNLMVNVHLKNEKLTLLGFCSDHRMIRGTVSVEASGGFRWHW